MKPELILDGVRLPPPGRSGYVVTPNRLWSENAGRSSATGKFIGDIIAVKFSVSVTWERLTDEEMQLLFGFSASTAPWHTLEFTFGGRRRKINCYIADCSYTMRRFDMREGIPIYDGVTFELIEQ